jgi:hypothetical protein
MDFFSSQYKYIKRIKPVSKVVSAIRQLAKKQPAILHRLIVAQIASVVPPSQ